MTQSTENSALTNEMPVAKVSSVSGGAVIYVAVPVCSARSIAASSPCDIDVEVS